MTISAGGGQPLLKRLMISDQEFDRIRELVYQHFGINLTEQKRSLVIGRLQKILRQMAFNNFEQYYAYVKADRSGQALNELVNRISTNHTFFYREKDHFDFFFDQALPLAMERKAAHNERDLRIWCAGCSSGEEAYTLVMLMMEKLGRDYQGWQAGLLATDISERVLDIAQKGIYAADSVHQLPKNLQTRYFDDLKDGTYQVKAHVKKEITYRRFNLMNESFPFRKPFDIIFCRNVMIYFDQSTRESLVQRFYEHTLPGGHFFIGHSESLRRDACPYTYVKPAVYMRNTTQ